MPTLCNPREHVSRGARMFRQHAGESIPRGRGWDGPGLEGDPLLAELRIVSEWAQLRGKRLPDSRTHWNLQAVQFKPARGPHCRDLSSPIGSWEAVLRDGVIWRGLVW